MKKQRSQLANLRYLILAFLLIHPFAWRAAEASLLSDCHLQDVATHHHPAGDIDGQVYRASGRLPESLTDQSSHTETLQVDSKPLAKSEHTLPSGQHYLEYDLARGDERSPEYQGMMQDTVEVIYSPLGKWGHLALRVGDRYYDYGQVGKYADRDFARMPNTIGFNYKIPKSKIHELQEKMRVITDNGTKYNVPPYDVLTLTLEVIQAPDGSLRYKSATEPALGPPGRDGRQPIIGNNEPIQANLVREGKTLFLKTPSGFTYPAYERDGHIYVKALNCINAVRMALEKVGVNIPYDYNAKTVTDFMHSTLSPGRPHSITPSFIIHYNKRPAALPSEGVAKAGAN